MTDPITEADLLAFVDDHLDVARRIEVEDYLAKHQIVRRGDDVVDGPDRYSLLRRWLMILRSAVASAV